MTKKRNTFISFSHENKNLALIEEIKGILEEKNIAVDYSEKVDRSDKADETIWKHLEKRIKGSSVTIIIMTKDLFEENTHKLDYKKGSFLESGWMYKEISASLRNWNLNNINGIIAVYEPELETYIQSNAKSTCNCCLNKNVTTINLSNEIIRKNMFNINKKNKTNKNCAYYDTENDHFISLISLKNFKNDPAKYIDNAIDKREKQMNDENYFTIEYNFHKKDN